MKFANIVVSPVSAMFFWGAVRVSKGLGAQSFHMCCRDL